MINIFPNYIQLKLNLIFVNEINDLVIPYKNNIKQAEVYSFKDNTIKLSEKRESLKTSFKNKLISKILNTRLLNVIKESLYNKINITDSNNLYNIELGDQDFDYIQYKNGGYFDKHRDFIRINNINFQQYTLLIGLSELKFYEGGSTILWIPLN